MLTYRLIPYDYERFREEAIRIHFSSAQYSLVQTRRDHELLKPRSHDSYIWQASIFISATSRKNVHVCICWPPGISTDSFLAIRPHLFILRERYNRVIRLSPTVRISDVCGKVRLAVPMPDISVLWLCLCDTVHSAIYLLAFEG